MCVCFYVVCVCVCVCIQTYLFVHMHARVYRFSGVARVCRICVHVFLFTFFPFPSHYFLILTLFSLFLSIYICLCSLSLRLVNLSLCLPPSSSPPGSPLKVTVFALVCTLTLMVASPDTRYSKAGLYAIFATQSNDFALGYPIGKI